MNLQREPKSKFKPFNAVIQKCDVCGKLDVVEGHEKECDPTAEQQQREVENNRYD